MTLTHLSGTGMGFPTYSKVYLSPLTYEKDWGALLLSRTFWKASNPGHLYLQLGI